MLVQLTPSSNAGGGGERVLWAAILATQKRWPNAKCIVYTGDHDVDKSQIISRVKVGNSRYSHKMRRLTKSNRIVLTFNSILPRLPSYTLQLDIGFWLQHGHISHS